MDPFSTEDPGPLPVTWQNLNPDDYMDMVCDWTDFRRDFGLSPDRTIRDRERAAFEAAWKAGKYGDQSGVLR